MSEAMLSRRGLITGLVSFVAAPAIVRASSLMPVKAIVVPNMPMSLLQVMEEYNGLGYLDFDKVMHELAKSMYLPAYMLVPCTQGGRT